MLTQVRMAVNKALPALSGEFGMGDTGTDSFTSGVSGWALFNSCVRQYLFL
jgi:hypothetical protein